MLHYVAGYWTHDGFEIHGVFSDPAGVRDLADALSMKPSCLVWDGAVLVNESFQYQSTQ